MKKNYEVRIKLSKEERERLKKKAAKIGLSTSAFIRMIALNAEVHATRGV